ncbi:MAG TPA: hypothetical protein VGM37_21480 [Armatimonadota bacterium]|jgi:hypothetical protein
MLATLAVMLLGTAAVSAPSPKTAKDHATSSSAMMRGRKTHKTSAKHHKGKMTRGEMRKKPMKGGGMREMPPMKGGAMRRMPSMKGGAMSHKGMKHGVRVHKKAVTRAKKTM